MDWTIGILLPPSNYVAHIVQPGLAVVDKHVVFMKSSMSGWIGEKVTAELTASDVPLDDDFVLRRANKDDNYHVLDKDYSAPLAMLDPIDGANHSKFPIYLAYKSRANNSFHWTG